MINGMKAEIVYDGVGIYTGYVVDELGNGIVMVEVKCISSIPEATPIKYPPDEFVLFLKTYITDSKEIMP